MYSTANDNPPGAASSGVISLNRMPGFGKSGTSRIRLKRSLMLGADKLESLTHVTGKQVPRSGQPAAHRGSGEAQKPVP